MAHRSNDQPPMYLGQQLYIKPNYIVSIPSYEKRGKRSSLKQERNKENLKDNNHKGKLSTKAKQRLKSAINWLVASAKVKSIYDRKSRKSFRYKVGFITLTVKSGEGQLIENSEFKALLHSWLSYCRKYYGLKNYIWKVEKHKSGQLHIHITTDAFIHWKNIRDSWNRILSKKGYLDGYYAIHGHYNANSTDVHAVHKVKNMAAYMVKYMAKDVASMEGFKGRIWGSNQELSDANKCEVFLDPDEIEKNLLPLMHEDIEWKPIEGKPDSMGICRRIGELYFIEASQWIKIIKGKIRDAYDWHRFHIREQFVKLPPEYYAIN